MTPPEPADSSRHRFSAPVLGWICAAAIVASVPVWSATDQAWRSTALATFDEVWQTVNESFEDPTFGGVNWAAVRTELRPKAESASSLDAVRDVIRTMLSRLNRSHFVLLAPTTGPAPTGPAVVPVEVRVTTTDVIVTRVPEGSTAAAAGLQPGSAIVSVDGEKASSWLESQAGAKSVDQRLRQLDTWRNATRALHGPVGSTATIVVRTPGRQERTLSIARTAETGEVVRVGNLPAMLVSTDVKALKTSGGRPVGYIAFNVWMVAAMPVIDNAVDRFRDADGLIIDLRGNPGGLVPMMSGVAGHIVADGSLKLGSIHTRQAQLSAPINPRLSTNDGRAVKPFAGPVAILVDELTGSASECFAGGLQALGRVRVFGRQTMGQALPASTKSLPNGDVLLYALGDFVAPNGRRIEGDGVIPDDAQPLSIEALAAGRDLPVEAALRWLDTVRR